MSGFFAGVATGCALPVVFVGGHPYWGLAAMYAVFSAGAAFAGVLR